MLHIIGIILKMIGIILAVILGILVLLVCIVLFVPVRYEGEAVFPGNVDDIHGDVYFSWLLHLITARLVYDDGNTRWWLRIGWKMKESKTPEKEVEEGKRRKSSRNPEKKQENETFEKDIKALEISDIKNSMEKTVTERECIQPEKIAKAVEGNMKRSLWQKIIAKIKLFFAKIKYTFKKICDNIRDIIDETEKRVRFFGDETHRNAFYALKKDMIWVKRLLKPKQYRLYLHFGFDDPYKTGQMLAVLSILYSIIGEYMIVEPEFEEQIMEGDFHIKGRLRIIYLTILIWKLYMNKDIYTTYQDIKNI